MALTAAQMEAREGKLTASRVRPLMTGEADKLLALWREMIGDPTFVADDLRGVWPVRLGEVTEQLQLDWYGEKRGCSVTRRGEVVIHPSIEWAAATLDGWDEIQGIPVECKHVGGREPRERILERYMPQFQWQMFVTKTKRLAASIIEGANEPVVETIAYDGPYVHELWQRAEQFMQCVQNMTPPAPLPAVMPKIENMKPPANMAGSNEWGNYAAIWLQTKAAANDNWKAEKSLKAMVPPDCRGATGNGVMVTRDRANRLSARAV